MAQEPKGLGFRRRRVKQPRTPWLAPQALPLPINSVILRPLSQTIRRILVDPAPARGLRGETPLWSADGKTVFFRSHDAAGNAFLWAIPASGGTPRQVMRLGDPSPPSYRRPFAISGGRVYFICEDRQSDVYAMEVVRR